MLDSLLSAFRGPGLPFMVAITAVMAHALAVSLERGWLLLVRWRVGTGHVLELLDGGDLAGAVAAAGPSPLGDVLDAGAAEDDPGRAWEAMGGAAAAAEARLRRRVASLSAAANIATMLGLLGTVYGLILAFSSLGDLGALQRGERLSAGISAAMATTAYGLLVGIPALALHAWLDGRAREAVAAIETCAARLVLALRRRTSAG